MDLPVASCELSWQQSVCQADVRQVRATAAGWHCFRTAVNPGQLERAKIWSSTATWVKAGHPSCPSTSSLSCPQEYPPQGCSGPKGTGNKLGNGVSPGSESPFSVTADVANPSAIADAAKIVEGKLNGAGLNLLINNAGIYAQVSLETVDSEEMIRAYRTNAVGPLLMAQVTLGAEPTSEGEFVAASPPPVPCARSLVAVCGHGGGPRVLPKISQGCGREGTAPACAPTPRCPGFPLLLLTCCRQWG